MIKLTGTLSYFNNPLAHKDNDYNTAQKQIVSVEGSRQAISDIKTWPAYAQTPLHALEGLAKGLGLDNIFYKDESERFGLKSFKALGGAYAVARQLQLQLQHRLGIRPSMKDLLGGHLKETLASMTVSCATDGNHGRSVAWGAQMFGCSCVIYIHEGVSEGRQQAIAAFGAEVVRISGNYDESVRLADRDAKVHNRIIVSDTSYEGYMDIPKDVALGYTVMLSEIVEQLAGKIPTHVFIQAGVGGLAATLTGYFWDLWGNDRPRVVIVEPEQANCLQLSAKAGKPVVVGGELTTLMAGLACGEVSALAWDILKNGADDFVTLSEGAIAPLMCLLAKGVGGAPKIEAGESGVVGLAAVMIACQVTELIPKLQLNKESRILVIGTEGATDPILYQTLVKG
ncbi:diaminopropionate ammonia-lyase [Shewanella surugensis]|uniref:Diaminopropionate ammonia-lyase n=1 Tax=Shewanella surugensis TaxID=212020 RepID=A0ABT0L9B5_9GAMM|nr:diaminopropionate ammonia-lyase [Shewanella surugensis]MCL1124274.1 diaminopropionate ammonia-lyase [Shewanella surugensis]